MLRLESVSAFYGAIQALRNVSLHVNPGEIVTLLGANGAGKTTLMKVISGLQSPSKGRLLFGGGNITGMAAEEILRLGIGQVPEGRQIFAPLSVLDNLILGAYVHYRGKGKKERQVPFGGKAAAALDRYLTDPMGVVPGTKMAFAGVKDAAKRQEIINYLKTL